MRKPCSCGKPYKLAKNSQIINLFKTKYTQPMQNPLHLLAQNQYSKRLLLSFLLLIIIALLFWSQSRIPALNDKAMMGGSILLQDPLSFEAEYPVNPSDPAWKRIATTSVNWVFTNLQGMTFGVFLGATFLCLLRYLPKRSFKNSFSNALLGLFLGAPLGVCVNCAAPIARGLFSGGTRLETSLAAMIASPTFNVIVLTMLFSLLPFYMAIIKISLSLTIIMLVIPLICQGLSPDELQICDTQVISCVIEPASDSSTEDLATAAQGFIKDYLRDLWYIIRITVPMMFLAGFLGALVATLLPLSMIQSLSFNFLALIGIVAIGLFLPVPIAFDIILAATLMSTGAPVGFVMALLFTLGIFSIYSYIIVAGTLSAHAALRLTLVIACFGIGSGYIAEAYDDWEFEQTLEALSKNVSFNLISSVQATTLEAIDKKTEESKEKSKANKITISKIPFTKRSAAAEKPFTRLEAWHIGIDRPNLFSIADMTIPFMQAPGSIAAADIDNDGDQDVIIGDNHGGIRIFHNDGKGKFKQQGLDLKPVTQLSVFQAAPADINNDGWIDLVISTFAEGEYVLYSDKGRFLAKNLSRVSNREDARHVLAIALGDLNRDGYLDLVLGNHSALPTFMAKGEFDRNRILYNDAGQFKAEKFLDTPGMPGETLSILVSDFNQDGALDLIEGNDFTEPDIFYKGNGKGGIKQITLKDGIIPVTTLTTMSVKSADLDNDGRLEIYLSQIAGRTQGVSDRLLLRSWDDYCPEMERKQDRDACEANRAIREWIIPGFMQANKAMVERCRQLPAPASNECRAMVLRNMAFNRKNPKLCDRIGFDQKKLSLLCTYITSTQHLPGKRGKAFPKDGEKKIHISQEDLANEIPQHFGGNILLVDQGNGKYQDRAEAANLEIGGWSWDVKIFDFDNDGLQDIHILNGDWILKKVTPSKIFMHNLGEMKFANKTREFGLEDYLIITSAAAADYDNDGDIDEIAQGVNGPVIAYWNNSQEGHSIAFEFRDFVANRFGVGNKLSIFYGKDNGHQQIRELKLSGGYSAFDAPVLHFGLGETDHINRIEIEWSNGGSSRIKGPFEADATYRVRREP